MTFASVHVGQPTRKLSEREWDELGRIFWASQRALNDGPLPEWDDSENNMTPIERARLRRSWEQLCDDERAAWIDGAKNVVLNCFTVMTEPADCVLDRALAHERRATEDAA